MDSLERECRGEAGWYQCKQGRNGRQESKGEPVRLMDWLVQGEGDAAVRDDVNLGARRSRFSNNVSLFH